MLAYGEPIAALEKPKQDGKIRHYGVSNFCPAMMDVCESAGHLAANQVGYHRFGRRVERAALPYTRSHGIGFMPYGTPSPSSRSAARRQLKRELRVPTGRRAGRG